MVTPPLLDYIRKTLAQGLSQEDIERSLYAIGWQPEDIQAGMAAVKEEIKISGNQFFYRQIAASRNKTAIRISVFLLFIIVISVFITFGK